MESESESIVPQSNTFLGRSKSPIVGLWFSILSLSSLCYPTYSFSQILVGLKLGLNSTRATVDTRNIAYTNTENLNQLQFGLVYDHAINNHWAIRSEVLYSQKGFGERKYFDAAHFDSRGEGNSSYWQFKMNYLEVPVMLKWFVENKKFKFYINGGMYLAYWLSASSNGNFFTTNLGDEYYTRKTAEDSYQFDSDYGINKRKDNRIDYGLVGGTGLAYKIDRGEFFIEGRYAYGLADRYIFEQSPIYYQPQMNRSLSVSVGFLLTLKPAKIRKAKINTDQDEPEEEDTDQR